MGPVVLLGDNRHRRVSRPTASPRHLQSPAAVLRTERSTSVGAPPASVRSAARQEARIPFVEVTDLVCGDEVVPRRMVGDQLVWDSNRLTTGYARGWPAPWASASPP